MTDTDTPTFKKYYELSSFVPHHQPSPYSRKTRKIALKTKVPPAKETG